MELIKKLKSFFVLYKIGFCIKHLIPAAIMREKWPEYATSKKFRKTFGRELNLEKPETLNEKIQWLKLYEHKDFHTVYADKYKARDVWKEFGEEGLIPLLYQTYDWREITTAILPSEPFIIKCNSAAACFRIIKNPNRIDIDELRKLCKLWFFKAKHYYIFTQEWQYKDIKPCILIEKLLLDEKGNIPNDYKLFFINGKLQFVYCSIDREGDNYRIIYDKDWNRTDIEWVEKNKHSKYLGADIAKPQTFDQMVSIGSKIAAKFRCVRVDFYEVDGHLYYGEITLHHGSGFDTFIPEHYDRDFGELLNLK